MDDLNSTISSILGDPNKMEQLRAVAESLGMNTGGGAPPLASPQPQPQMQTQNQASAGGGIDPAAIASIVQNFQTMMGGGGAAAAPQNNASAPSTSMQMPNMGTISKVAEIMGTYNKSDKNVDLLRSLRPHFSTARAGRIDDAVRIMQLMRAWPALRDSGLLGSLGNLFGGGGER